MDKRTKTTGVIFCEHIRTLDIKNRKFIKVEPISKDILENVISVVFSEIEQY